MKEQLYCCFMLLVLGTAREYIKSRVAIKPDTGCWVWRGCNDGRYGRAYFLGERFKSHRLSYLAFVGRIRAGKVLDHHRCDHTRCCRPDHLLATTQSKNMKRCFAAGRGKSPFIKE